MDTSINYNNHTKRLDHCLWLCRTARVTRNFPRLDVTGFFWRKRSGEFEGEIR